MFFFSYFLKFLKKYIYKIEFFSNSNILKLFLLDVNDLIMLITFLKLHSKFQYNLLVDIVCTDLLKKKKRFDLNYIFLSSLYNTRLILNFQIDENVFLPSLTNIFKNSNWLEREVFDLFGIFFINHLDLRRILTDYGFNGFPFRKDFPLNGFFELRYDESKQFVIYEPLELMQTIRFFDFSNPFINVR